MNNFYIISEYYRRDTQFVYDYDLNKIDQYEFSQGVALNIDLHEKILYVVDKIDSYLLDYDFLPVIGPPLVSERFKKLLLDETNDECQFFPVTISDRKTILEGKYYILNIIKAAECVDENRSQSKVDKSLEGLQRL